MPSAGRDRGRGMRGAERVVFALGALGEAGQPAALAQGADAVAPAGQDLVRIGLVADVPDQPVVRRVEDVMQRDGQFDHAKPGAEMAAGLGDGVDGLGGAARRRAAGAVRPTGSSGRWADVTRSSSGVLVALGQEQLRYECFDWSGGPAPASAKVPPAKPRGLHQIGAVGAMKSGKAAPMATFRSPPALAAGLRLAPILRPAARCRRACRRHPA